MNSAHKQKDILLIATFIIFAVIVSDITNDWQFGLSPDSCTYIGGAINLADGYGYKHNYVDAKTLQTGKKMISSQPPLYSAIIAFVSLFGIAAVKAGLWISFFSMIISVALVYLIGLKLFGRKGAVWSAFICASTVAFINKGFWAWTETSFTLLVLLSVWFYLCGRTQKTTSRRLISAALCAIFLALSCYDRFIGLFAAAAFGLAYLTLLRTDKNTWKELITFCVSFFVCIIPLFIFNYYASGRITGPTRSQGEEHFYEVFSQAISGLTNVFSGGFMSWTRWGEQDHLYAKIGLLFFAVLVAFYIYLLIKQKTVNIILGCFIITLAALVLLRTLKSFDPLDSHGSRLMSPLFPFVALMIGGSVNIVVETVSKNRSRVLKILVALLIASSYLTLQAGYAQGGAADYARFGIRKVPKTMQWIKNNINKGARLITNYYGLRIYAETNEYYLIRMPAGSKKPWDQKDFKRITKKGDPCWLVFIWHPEKHKSIEANRYGPYIFDLLSQGDSDHFTLVAKLPNGLVFKATPDNTQN